MRLKPATGSTFLFSKIQAIQLFIVRPSQKQREWMKEGERVGKVEDERGVEGWESGGENETDKEKEGQ